MSLPSVLLGQAMSQVQTSLSDAHVSKMNMLHVLIVIIHVCTLLNSFHTATGISVVNISDTSALVTWTVSCLASL